MFRRKTCRRSRRSEGHAMFKSLAFAGLLLALLPNQVSAQAPTQAQRDAIRAACRSDFMANCSGVQPGGKEAFECLLRNDAKLSPSCQAAVNAATPKPTEAAEPAAPATAAPAQSETVPPAAKVEHAPPGVQVAPAEAQNDALKTVQQACTLNDFVAHCSWIAANNPEILLCLKGNAADLSPNCQAAVQSLPAAAPPAAAAPPRLNRHGRRRQPRSRLSQSRRSRRAPAPRLPRPHPPPRPPRRRRQRRSRKLPSAPRAAPISCRVAQACSPAAPKRCNVSKATRRSSRPRAAAPWPRSAVAAPARRQPRPERRLLLRRQRSHQSGQCRCCARATRWRSCKSAALKCGRSAPAFRSAAAVSSVASPQTHRACRRAVTAR